MAVGEAGVDIVAALFREHYSQLVGLGVVLTGERELAEDLAQESFARLLSGWGRMRDQSSAPAYLRTTLVNLARSAVRRRIVRRRKEPLLSHSDMASDSAERTAVIDALRTLPYRQRACIALRFYEGLSADETAAAMGTSVGTVKSQTHKALRRLQRVFEEDG